MARKQIARFHDRSRGSVRRPPARCPQGPRGKHSERTAVRRLSAMKYRLAGATYRVIAEKLTEEKACAYADAKGISIDRAMKKIQPCLDRDSLGRRDGRDG